MVSRERILDAAARVYAKHGFRGATTRLIAIEADVNEVTLFRTFGSKGALLEAVLTHNDSLNTVHRLPLDPVDARSELTAWVDMSIAKLRELRPLLIHTMSELEERPQAAEFACNGRQHAHAELRGYVERLQAVGAADPDADVMAAVAMLISAVMGDVMGRPMVPDAYPPEGEVAERYVRCFLRMIAPAQSAGVTEQDAGASVTAADPR